MRGCESREDLHKLLSKICGNPREIVGYEQASLPLVK